MSDSPWSATAVFDQIEQEIGQDERLPNGMLSLDESGERCFDEQKAGAGRQHIGKVDPGQVGVGAFHFSWYHAAISSGVEHANFLSISQRPAL